MNPKLDKVTLERIKTAHPLLRTELELIYREIVDGISTPFVTVRFTHVLRTFVQQQELYSQGRTKPGKVVTWAKAGYSYHNYGLAVDICLLIDRDKNGTFEEASWDMKIDGDNDGTPEFFEAVKIFEKHGWEWGGRWARPKTDNPHFQKTLGYNIQKLLAINTKKDFIPNTTYVNIKK